MAGLVQRFKEMWASDEEYEYEDATESENGQGYRERAVGRGEDEEAGNRVVNIHSAAKLQVVLFKPERFGEDTRSIADELLKMHTIVLNLEETNKDSSRRIVDFLSGVAYANGGKIKKVATDTFVITPYNVDITGDDVLDELENSGVYL